MNDLALGVKVLYQHPSNGWIDAEITKVEPATPQVRQIRFRDKVWRTQWVIVQQIRTPEHHAALHLV